MASVQFLLETTADKVEALSEHLFNAGAVAVTLEDASGKPIFEPLPNTEPLWDRTRVIGLFEEHADLINIKKYLKKQLDLPEFESLKIEILKEEDWTTISQASHFLCFEKTLCIGSETEKEKGPKGAAFLILEPGLAFGTGSHESTQLCLNFLALHPPKNKLILDYGSGSGILGLAALKLGAKFIYACDHDPQAIQSTQQNAEKNGFTKQQIETFLPSQLPTPLKVDIILANILANPLMSLSESFSKWLTPNGTIVLSGILDSQQDLIVESYKPWFKDFNITSSKEWICITATLK